LTYAVGGAFPPFAGSFPFAGAACCFPLVADELGLAGAAFLGGILVIIIFVRIQY
jgi:hypothetical protein